MEQLTKTYMLESKDAHYNRSERGKARTKRYRDTDRFRRLHANYRRERYHRIQEEAGYHIKESIVYPGYCFIEALLTAETVEV